MSGDPAAPPTTTLLGLPFADLDAAAAAAWLASLPVDTPFGYAVTPNADHLVRLHRDPSLAPIYQAARVRLLDSRVVARVGRWLGLAVPRVAPGSDVSALLLRHHLRPDDRLTIIGLPETCVARLVADFGLLPPAHLDPPMGFDGDPAAFAAAVRFVVSHPARFVFLAVGSPRQERLAAAIAATGAARGIGLCIGASLAFLAGAERRAPAVIQRAGFEWLFRLIMHPHRLWRRYLVDSPAVLGLLLAERRNRGRRGDGRTAGGTGSNAGMS